MTSLSVPCLTTLRTCADLEAGHHRGAVQIPAGFLHPEVDRGCAPHDQLLPLAGLHLLDEEPPKRNSSFR